MEGFSGGSGSTPPTGWTNNIIAGDAGFDTWRYNNPGGRTINAPLAGQVAIFDSDDYSSGGGAEDVALQSPTFNAGSVAIVYLSWDQHFQSGFGGAITVEVSDGLTWTSVYTTTTGTPNPDFQLLDITAATGGSTLAQVRFRWAGNWSWWWMIDNVRVADTLPPSPPTFTVSIDANGTATPLADGATISVGQGTSVASLDLAFTLTDPDAGDTLTISAGVAGGSLINGFQFSEWEAGPGSLSVSAAPSSGTFYSLGTVSIQLTASDGVYPPIVFNFSLEIVAHPSPGITTTFAGGNSFAGNMFDISVFNTSGHGIAISALDIHTTTTSQLIIGVYYKSGTYVGSESTAADWTLHEFVTVTSQGSGNPTTVPFTHTLNLAAGQTYGLYVNVESYPAASIVYTNGTLGTGGAHFGLSLGIGHGSPAFSGIIVPTRIWNGTIHYDLLTATTAPTFASTAITTGMETVAYSYMSVATGGPSPTYSFSGTLPAWLNWDNTLHTLSGTPGMGDAGVYGPFTITATNGVSPAANQTFSITVAGPAPLLQVRDPGNEVVVNGSTRTLLGFYFTGPAMNEVFTILNVGAADLEVTGIAATVSTNVTVLVTPNTALPYTLSAGTNDTFVLDVNPDVAAGPFTVTLQVTTTQLGTFTWTYNGTVAAVNAPEIAVETDTGGNITNGQSLNVTGTGTVVFLRTFVVYNDGSATLNLPSGLVISGETNCQVTLLENLAGSISGSFGPTRQSDTFTLGIFPLAPGTFSFTVTIDNDDSDENPFVFTFNGNTAGGGGGGKKKGGGGDKGGCSTGDTGSMNLLALLAAIAGLGLAVRMRRGRA
ncbi:MAG: putative Ig domain-containing protein [Planctomycetota bacterium]|nr:putative Ig domain-containing protein [Planctomycetota bacterium]